jgi:hypothetical protein
LVDLFAGRQLGVVAATNPSALGGTDITDPLSRTET